MKKQSAVGFQQSAFGFSFTTAELGSLGGDMKE
jgi:hypothetical protein